MVVKRWIKFWSVTTQITGWPCFGRWQLNQYVCLKEIQNSKVLHTYSVSDYARANNPPQERIFKYTSLAKHLQFLIISWTYFDRLQYIFAIAVATSTLFSSKTLFAISCLLASNISASTVTHSWFLGLRSSSQKWIFYLIKEWRYKIISKFRSSDKLKRNLPLLIFLKREKHRSLGSLCCHHMLITLIQ